MDLEFAALDDSMPGARDWPGRTGDEPGHPYPLDSRGLWPVQPQAVPSAPCPTLPAPGPCETCGKEAPWLYHSIEQGRDVYGCPKDDAWGCAGRALEAKRAADRAEAKERPTPLAAARAGAAKGRETLLGAAQPPEDAA